jgi:HAD superfamily hydrolase (TIGR01549 family)
MKQWLKGIIFDLDGTLVDSPLDFDAIRQDLGLSKGAPILEEIAARHREEQIEMHRKLLDHELQAAKAASPMEGVEDFLRLARVSGWKLAIFTRNAKSVAELTLKRMGWEFSIVVSREDAPPKPSPAGLQRILAEWGLNPEEVVYVGDYLFDVEAGRSAGIPTLLYQPKEEPTSYAPMAAAVFRSYGELHGVLGKLR